MACASRKMNSAFDKSRKGTKCAAKYVCARVYEEYALLPATKVRYALHVGTMGPAEVCRR